MRRVSACGNNRGTHTHTHTYQLQERDAHNGQHDSAPLLIPERASLPALQQGHPHHSEAANERTHFGAGPAGQSHALAYKSCEDEQADEGTALHQFSVAQATIAGRQQCEGGKAEANGCIGAVWCKGRGGGLVRVM